MKFRPELSVNQNIQLPFKTKVTLHLKREDLIHPIISGNKYRKLKYNIAFAEAHNHDTLLTFGGAFSNHIAATAEAGRVYGFKTIGIIRGEELHDKIQDNPTLKFAQSCGMQFKFISREQFRLKSTQSLIEKLKREFGDFYQIPEGGTNDLAIKGCQEILTPNDKQYDCICASVGTGGTLSGLINSSSLSQQVLGFSALKGDFLKEDISKFATQNNWQLLTNYHFGGYAKINGDLVTFINQFKTAQQIALDPVYTGKMLFGIFELIQNGFFKDNAKILAIHTGGIQGIEGMNKRLKQKQQQLII
ncbi:1-aminocyclopropane-1-carboxylate deaminase/D-cysteine desulfhydrase [Olleya aquimaris]|uniref:1-aminocyclopropane-1-carboxylate deaminase/D-cysteine desulfhydrase n=1 Tax=uncultured Olleya sp. TaxID=757243 RepID=UPI000E324676|nr:pyridoxal-phosphate dependent enzyme [uncultured Olleya sp.]AXO80244.1 1-aminocyclopropane-1-carboxylate deaminase/D-cysteine desulfhydrase [Olleya aquimaris]